VTVKLAHPPGARRLLFYRGKPCEGFKYGAAPLRLVSDHELKRAALFVFRKRAGPLLITANTRDEWTYQAALDEAMAAVRRDESGTESGVAGLKGEGSTRSR
jgi:hypothetical protein